MDKPLLIKSMFMFVSLWGIAILLLWFRRSIEIFWKIIATLILVFYIWFFFEEVTTGYRIFLSSAGWYNATVNFLTELTSITFSNLFFLWPIMLIVIFYKADDIGAERLLKFMCILTMLLWVIYIIFVFHNKEISEFIQKNLKFLLNQKK